MRGAAMRCLLPGSRQSLSWQSVRTLLPRWWDSDDCQRLRMARAQAPADVGRAACGQREVVSTRHRAVRTEAVHVREQFPGRPPLVLVHRAVESVQEADEGLLRR